MPNAMIKKYAKDHNMPINEVEKKWNESKAIVEKEYPDVKKESTEYFKLVVGVFKKIMGDKDE